MSPFSFKTIFATQSDRVKAIDFHSVQPLVLIGLFNGTIELWNYEKQQLLHRIQVSEKPVRSLKFIERKQWFVSGSDDCKLNIFDIDSGKPLKSIDNAHSDFIRSIAVHPTKPCILTASDDFKVKLWNWEQDWTVSNTYTGHTHYVMSLALNPRDANQFATCSIDRTIRIWNIDNVNPLSTLEGHELGVNALVYSRDGLQLISGSDDKTLKIWNCETGECITTLADQHTDNITSIHVDPALSTIFSASEDGSVRLWKNNKFEEQLTLDNNQSQGRKWVLTFNYQNNLLAIGSDNGSIIIKY